MELLSSVKRKTRVSSSSATLSTEGILSPENKRIKDVEDELSCHEGIRSLRKRVTSQTCHFANCQFANVLGRFANASQSIRKRNMNQRKSTEENHVTFNHYKWWIDCVTRLIDEQCRKIHAQYHFIKPLNDLLNYSLVFTNIYKCDGFCVIDDNRVSWNARSEDRVLNTYPR